MYMPILLNTNCTGCDFLTFEDYQSLIKGRMSEKRFIHSVNMAEAAAALAKRYGADPEKARVAGILHDITKETPREEQLQILGDNAIILDDIQKITPKLWHSITGSVYVKQHLGITDIDILNAIRYHTSGRPNMSLLEKIIFIADFIGAERDYDGVDVMREKAQRSLEEAMEFGLSYTICDLAQRKLPIHRDALEAYNNIVANRLERNTT